MLLKQRIEKLENKINVKPCFCNKTLLDLWYGGADADALSYCSNCKDKFDHWQNLAREAASELSKNLTDGEL